MSTYRWELSAWLYLSSGELRSEWLCRNHSTHLAPSPQFSSPVSHNKSHACLPYLAYYTRNSLLEVDPCHCKQQSLSCLGVQIFPVPSALTFSVLWLQVCTTAWGFSRWVLRIKLRCSCFCCKNFSNIPISPSHWCCLALWSVTVPFPIEFVLINNCTHDVL